MQRGYVKLWRKALDSGWLKNPELWVLWTYCLLKATHKEHDAIVGLQTIHLVPGQFIFGLRKASDEMGMKPNKIRTRLEFLKKEGNLTIKTTNKFSIITIVNWQSYQSGDNENDTQNDKQKSNKEQHTRTEEQENRRTPADISSEITALQEKFSPELLSQVFSAISSTRKANRITDSVKLKILQDWQKHPIGQVEAGIRTYLDKDCPAQGKGEKYLLGIIRNQNGEPGKGVSGESDPMVRKSSGSPALDEHYRSQGYKVIP